jgi:hypothetical protein
MSKYPPLFKRIHINPETEGKLIAEVQTEFEKFWRNIQRKAPHNSERTLALRKMQEACMWFTRAIAIGGFHPDDQADSIRISKEDCEKIDLRPFKDQPHTLVAVKNDSLNQELKKALKSKNSMPSKPIC